MAPHCSPAVPEQKFDVVLNELGSANEHCGFFKKCCIFIYLFIFKNADTYALFENYISARKNNVCCMSSLHGKTGRSARLCRSPWSPARLCCLTSRSTGWLCVSPPTSQDRCAVWLLASCKQPWRTNPALCSFVSLLFCTQSATPANPLFLSLSLFFGCWNVFNLLIQDTENIWSQRDIVGIVIAWRVFGGFARFKSCRPFWRSIFLFCFLRGLQNKGIEILNQEVEEVKEAMPETMPSPLAYCWNEIQYNMFIY